MKREGSKPGRRQLAVASITTIWRGGESERPFRGRRGGGFMIARPASSLLPSFGVLAAGAMSSLPLRFPWRIGRVFGGRVEAHDAVRADAPFLVEAHAFVGEPDALRMDGGGLLRFVLAFAAEAVQRAIRADDAVSRHGVAAVRVGPHELPDRARARRRRLGNVAVRRHSTGRDGPNDRIDQIALGRHRCRLSEQFLSYQGNEAKILYCVTAPSYAKPLTTDAIMTHVSAAQSTRPSPCRRCTPPKSRRRCRAR